jgi:hypothetical protein
VGQFELALKGRGFGRAAKCLNINRGFSRCGTRFSSYPTTTLAELCLWTATGFSYTSRKQGVEDETVPRLLQLRFTLLCV